jgi:hypothetical protein
MDIKKPRRSGLAFVRDKQQCRNRLYTIQIQYQSFEGIAVVFLSF